MIVAHFSGGVLHGSSRALEAADPYFKVAVPPPSPGLRFYRPDGSEVQYSPVRYERRNKVATVLGVEHWTYSQ